MKIRLATKDDTFEILKLLAHNEESVGAITEETTEGTETRILDNMCICVYANNGKLVGTCSFNMSKHYIQLTDLCITKSCRRKKLSYVLMYACVEEASNIYKNDFDVYINTLKSNEIANLIYKKIGKFAFRRENDNFYKIDKDRLLKRSNIAKKRNGIVKVF